MHYNNIITIFKCTKINKKSQKATMIDYNIIMNFECKFKQKITNGNCDGLLFVMCSNTTIEIVDGDDDL
jgi:hypothetical protein